jgi:hypothetical protein
LNSQLEYIEVHSDDRKSIVDLDQFYTSVYIEAFPDENEREKFDNILKYIKRKESIEHKYHIVLAKDKSGVVIGGVIFNYFKKSNSGVVEFLAVRKDRQSGGVGTQLYKRTMRLLSADAHKYTGKSLDYVFCEIDSPEYSQAEIKKYLYFWNKNKYLHLKFDYVQPALSVDQEPVIGLWFIVSPQKAQNRVISSSVVVDVLYDYIKYAIAIDKPDNNAQFVAMKAQLDTMRMVEIEKIC